MARINSSDVQHRGKYPNMYTPTLKKDPILLAMLVFFLLNPPNLTNDLDIVWLWIKSTLLSTKQCYRPEKTPRLGWGEGVLENNAWYHVISGADSISTIIFVSSHPDSSGISYLVRCNNRKITDIQTFSSGLNATQAMVIVNSLLQQPCGRLLLNDQKELKYQAPNAASFQYYASGQWALITHGNGSTGKIVGIEAGL